MVYFSFDSAREAIKEHIRDQVEAVEGGDMEDHATAQDFRIMACFCYKVTLGRGKCDYARTLVEASRVCRLYIEKHNLTAGCNPDSPAFTGGQVYEGRKQIARVSYNGRVWGMDGKELAI